MIRPAPLLLIQTLDSVRLRGGGSFFDDSSGPLDLIHRAVLMNDMSLSDFRRQQQNRFANEAANFRQLQQEALQNQPISEEGEASEAKPEAE